MAVERWETGQAVRLRYLMYNERLTVNALTMRLTGGDGHLIRLAADLDITDEFTLGLTWVEYGASAPERLLYPYRHNDTLLINLRWGL